MRKEICLLALCCFYVCLLFMPLSVGAQNSLQKENGRSLPLIRKELNKISDPHHTLAPFYDKLNNLSQFRQQAGKKVGNAPYTVSIMHIGDSHIQAGF